MEATTIIRRPLITEKNAEAMEHDRYAFEVDRRATKTDIRRAIEELFEVRVVGVNTIRRKGAVRRTRFGWTKSREMKKAIVKLHPEDRIEFF